MVITRLEKDGASYCPAKADGEKIVLGVDGNSLIVNAKDHWGAEQGIVDVYTHGQSEPLTLDGDDTASGIYNVATIVIPPQKTELIEAGTETDAQTGEEKTVVKMETEPLDMAAVQVTLWPLPFEIAAPAEKQEETATETAETKEEA